MASWTIDLKEGKHLEALIKGKFAEDLDNAAFEALYAGAKKVKKMTQEELTSCGIHMTNQSKWFKGIKAKKDYPDVVVHIMGYPTLRLAENGTTDREYTTNQGVTRKTGKMPAYHFFRNARNRKAEIQKAMNDEWHFQLNKVW